MEVFAPLQRIHQLTGHPGSVYGLCRGSGQSHILSGGGDGWVVSWDLKDPEPGKLLARIPDQVFTIMWLDKSKTLLAGTFGGGLYRIRPDRGEEASGIHHHDKGVFALALLGDVVYSGGGDGRITRWSPDEGRPMESLRITSRSIRCLEPLDDQLLAAGCSDGRIILIDTVRWLPVHEIRDAHLPSVFCLRKSPASHLLWSGGRDARLRCWDLNNGREKIFEAPAHWYTINALAIDPSGEILATASRDKTIRLWNAVSGDLLQSLDPVRDQGHRHSVNNLFWSDFDGSLISASDDRSLIIWQAANKGADAGR